MVFSSLLFLCAFLPINLILYFSTKKITVQNVILLVFSLIFYAWGEPVFVCILLGMSFLCWLCSLGIDKSQTKKGKRFFIVLCTLICLGTLGVFKYASFFITNTNALFGTDIPAFQLTMPIGISFYTFQLLTYAVDVYREDVKAQKNYFYVLLYAGLFHQCVAGPIVRYGDVENELKNRSSEVTEVFAGIQRFSVGLAKKSVLANACGALADTLLVPEALPENAAELLAGRSALTLWLGMAYYMLQIYLDFSAYSDMAIGLGLMCGFHYKENFNYPYTARSVTEFWRCWHMSLGSFFRDYVYIPLGGNRKGKLRTLFNMLVVWLLTGFWHGADWNFILWGLYFFIFLALEKLFLLKPLQKLHVLSRIYLVSVVYFGWILFRFRDLSIIFTILNGMFCRNGNPLYSYELISAAKESIVLFIVSVLAVTPLAKSFGKAVSVLAEKSEPLKVLSAVIRVLIPVILLLISAVCLVGDTYNPFLYFQF